MTRNGANKLRFREIRNEVDSGRPKLQGSMILYLIVHYQVTNSISFPFKIQMS